MAEKAAKKKPNIFVRVGRGIVRFFKDVRGEMKRIVWPSGKQVGKNLLVVVVFVVLCALLIFGLDALFGWIFQLLIQLSEYIKSRGLEGTEDVAAAISLLWF